MAGGKTRKKQQQPGWANNNNIIPYKKRGKNRHVMDTIMEKGGIRRSDVVLEINPGLGNITPRLLEAAKEVVFVEADPILAQHLRLRFNNNRLKVIQGDVFNRELPYFDICVANLPLNYSFPITLKLLSHRPLFRCALIMVPKEFAMRLTAQPNDSFYCSLSVNVQLLASVTHLTAIGKNKGSPQHRSNLSLVRLEPKDPPPLNNFKDWYGLVGICFLKKSRTIGSLFKLKSVLSMLEKNSNKSLRDVSGDKELDISAYISALENAFGGLSVGGDDVDEEMEEGGVTKRSEFKDRVLGVLKEARLEQKRCSQLTQADILSLLSLFNKAGILFS